MSGFFFPIMEISSYFEVNKYMLLGDFYVTLLGKQLNTTELLPVAYCSPYLPMHVALFLLQYQPVILNNKCVVMGLKLPSKIK